MKKTVWWINPGWIFTILIIPNILIANSLSSDAYLFNWRTPKYFSDDLFRNAILSTILFAIGSWFTTFLLNGIYQKRFINFYQPLTEKGDYSFLLKVFNFSYVLTIFGYVYWTYLAFVRGLNLNVLIEMLTGSKGAMYELKNFFSTVSGLTTFTQFGILTAVLSVYIGVKYGWNRVKSKLMILIVITVFRAFFLSERLAILEVIIPVFVCLIGLKAQKGIYGKWRLLMNLSPLIGLSFFVVYFSISEYFRSWSNYYYQFGTSFIEFCITRLAGYYVTALNNGAMLVDVIDKKLTFPYFTNEWLWNFPVIGPQLDVNKITAISNDFSYRETLVAMANPEFNNPSGLFLPFVDYGIVGGILFWLVAGICCGFIYHLFVTGNILGSLCYPILYIGLLESPRVLYWTEGRVFPTWMLLLIISFILTLRNKNKEALNKIPNKKYINWSGNYEDHIH